MTKTLPLKFAIGFVAGLCAALFPRLIAELATSGNGDSEVIALFRFNYVFLSLVFATLIGMAIMIFEWESSRSPKDVFMSALALPAILSGALNTTTSVTDLKQAELEKTAYENTLQRKFQIPTREPAMLMPISKMDSLNIFFINNAYADSENYHQSVDYGISLRKNQSSYVVVLDEATSKNEAEAKATTLRDHLSVKIFQDNSRRFFITTNSGPQNKTNALLEAVRLKEEKGLSPSLMKIK